MKVYVVWSGHYSDAAIVGIFSTREAAEKLIDDQPARMAESYSNRLQAHVDEYELDAAPFEGGRPLYAYQAEVGPDGSIRYLSANAATPDHRDGEAEWGSGVEFAFLARDDAHATKIAGERWARWKARKEGMA